MSWPKLQFDRARERAGLRGGPHTLRHTFASHFLASVPDIGLLAEVLGHSEESVTRLYQHMLPERLARARNVVPIAPPPRPVTPASTPREPSTRKANALSRPTLHVVGGTTEEVEAEPVDVPHPTFRVSLPRCLDRVRCAPGFGGR